MDGVLSTCGIESKCVQSFIWETEGPFEKPSPKLERDQSRLYGCRMGLRAGLIWLRIWTSSSKKVKFALSTPLRCRGGVEVEIH